MRCTSPRTVGFEADGKTICWSKKKYSKEYSTFQLPCGKCIECRLEYSRQWAIRCIHEAQMHEKNSFLTLTYSNENLTSPKLNYEDFQRFMKRLRKVQDAPMGVFVTGEYGDEEKRPHWHAIIFNWAPNDLVYRRTNVNGDKIYSSRTLGPYDAEEVSECKQWPRMPLWPFGKCEVGSVTLKSAGYVARYAAKKLIHGKDGEHEYEPISRKSSKHAIGKKWLETYWSDVFRLGAVALKDGTSTQIPRYYEKWLKEHKPTEWLAYVTELKIKNMLKASEKSEAEFERWFEENWQRLNQGRELSLTETQRKKIISDQKFQMLQAYLKL